MRDEDKTKEDLIDELREMRRRVRKLRNEEVSGQTCNTRDSSDGFTIGADFTRGNKAENISHGGIATIEALLNATSDMVYLVDREGAIIVANHRGVEFLGGSHHKLMGASIFDFFPPKLAAERREKLDEVIRSGSPLIFEDKHYARHFENSLYPILGEEGGEGIAIYSRDITNHKRAEKALTESKEKYKRLIEMMNEGLWVQDENGIISFANDRLCEMLGYSSKEMIGHRVAEFIDKPNLKKLEDPTCKREQQSAPACEIEWRGKDGRTVWTIVSPSSLHDAEGVFLGNFAVITDITDRKCAEEELKKHRDHLEELVEERTEALTIAKEQAEQASRAKSEFLANMSHEIRTPMNGIMGMTQLALNTELTDEQREYLEAVEASADSLLRVINDVLDFSKIEAGKLELVSVDFSLRDTIADAMTTLAVQAHRKGLELVYEIPAETPDAFVGDPGRIRQILINLIGNAIKFTEAGEVGLRVQSESETKDEISLRFSVTDTGIGIPAEKREKIFQAFEQADTSATRKYGGTGLGLAISSQLVQMMGGQIWVESEVGRGTTFHFAVCFGLQSRPMEAALAQDASNFKDLSVLIVDDNATNRRILEHTIAHWGMKPTVVDGGPAALAALDLAQRNGSPFDLMITDCMMPEMDGFDLAERVNRDPCLVTTTIIMLTSAGERGDGARCMRLGIGAYLLKPVRQSELFLAIARVLQKPISGVGQPSLITRHSIRESKRRLHILLAEDNIINQKLAVKTLERMGHTVSIAADGKQALEVLGQRSFDLILMDVQMPIMDGLESTKLIRDREKDTALHVPIMAMTAHAMKGDKDRCLEAGMDGYISKPIDPQELFDAIESLLSRPEVVEKPLLTPSRGRAILDRGRIFDRVEGDMELLKEVIDLFIGDYPRLLSDIREAIPRRDAETLHKAAHALKGSVGNFAAEAASQAAFKLELMGRNQDLSGAQQALLDLEHEIELVVEELLSLEREIEQREHL